MHAAVIGALATLFIVMAFCWLTPAKQAYAVDSRVSASDHWVYTWKLKAADVKKHKNNNWKKGYYTAGVDGYVTSNAKHYANAALYCWGEKVLTSGRKWGMDKVTANTGWYSGCAIVPDYFGSSIFYGFSS